MGIATNEYIFKRDMQYDYYSNYFHINNVNIILELIDRYVVELLNPQLRNFVERKKEYYLERYKNLLEMKINR